jgi:PAS domain-containing protein
MKEFSGFFTFRIDPGLAMEVRKELESTLEEFPLAQVIAPGEKIQDPKRVLVDFISESGLLDIPNESASFKICVLDKNQGLFSFGQDLEESKVDAILDSGFDTEQIQRLLTSELEREVAAREEEINFQSFKNLKKFEQKSRAITQRRLEEDSGISSEALMDFVQGLVDLEKELIQSDGISKITKIIKQYAKNHLDKHRFQLWQSHDLAGIEVSKNFLPLPRYKGDFLAMELNWDEEDPFKIIRKIFFYQTLLNFFLSGTESEDPFFDEDLWENILDSIPFPVALLTSEGDICQHNTLFSKLNFPPSDCLGLKVKDKIVIHDIPYNVFRKDIHHLETEKILFVFFTESFFLKGEGNLTPTGQELGIISSSIAHELNNPIAGIQAALSLLMLDETMNEEAQGILSEMKNGAIRCKQLVETFLGFSRANPNSLHCIEEKQSQVEICYQQAQNLLRFRTVESGIRFNLTYSKHADFRHQVNLSLFTMTFYLIMGELMTLYSHQMLVASKNQVEKVIRGEMVESSQEISIQLHELNLGALSLSKLIQNLLTIENFVLQVSDYSLRFIYSPLR